MPLLIDIVLPCYNPNDTWYLELLKFNENVKQHYNVNYIIVNDGSFKENISEQIDLLQRQGLQLDFISYATNMGKGFALRRGVSVAMSEYITYTDIDFPFTDQSWLDLVGRLITGKCDVVAGYRDHNYYQNKMSWFRKQLSRSFRYVTGRLLKMPVTDTQCGLKGFNRKGREKFLQTSINRYLFDFEFIYTSCRDRSVQVCTSPAGLKENVVFSSMQFKILLQETINLISVLIFRRS